MLDIRTPLVYRTDLVSDEMLAKLISWTFDYPPISDPYSSVSEVSLYYRPSLGSEAFGAIEWARSTIASDPEEFLDLHGDHGFMRVASTKIDGEAYDKIPPPPGHRRDTAFEVFLRREEDRYQGRYLLTVTE